MGRCSARWCWLAQASRRRLQLRRDVRALRAAALDTASAVAPRHSCFACTRGARWQRDTDWPGPSLDQKRGRASAMGSKGGRHAVGGEVGWNRPGIQAWRAEEGTATDWGASGIANRVPHAGGQRRCGGQRPSGARGVPRRPDASAADAATTASCAGLRSPAGTLVDQHKPRSSRRHSRRRSLPQATSESAPDAARGCAGITDVRRAAGCRLASSKRRRTARR